MSNSNKADIPRKIIIRLPIITGKFIGKPLSGIFGLAAFLPVYLVKGYEAAKHFSICHCILWTPSKITHTHYSIWYHQCPRCGYKWEEDITCED